MNNQKHCTCCGQSQPFPTEPGEWEYTEQVYMDNPYWAKVTVKLPEPDDETGQSGLRLWQNGEMIWWPNNCAWRKL